MEGPLRSAAQTPERDGGRNSSGGKVPGTGCPAKQADRGGLLHRCPEWGRWSRAIRRESGGKESVTPVSFRVKAKVRIHSRDDSIALRGLNALALVVTPRCQCGASMWEHVLPGGSPRAARRRSGWGPPSDRIRPAPDAVHPGTAATTEQAPGPDDGHRQEQTHQASAAAGGWGTCLRRPCRSGQSSALQGPERPPSFCRRRIPSMHIPRSMAFTMS